VAALAGAGLLVAAVPALAARPQAALPAADADESAALVLLVGAAQASRTLTYSGTQYVATWGPAATSTTLVDVQHRPGRGARVQTTGEAVTTGPVVLPTGALHEQLLDVLRDGYRLTVAGRGRDSYRPAHVVEAHRHGQDDAAAVAGRFWVDDETGLLLRREVFDTEGRRLRSSAFLDLEVRPTGPAATRASLAGAADADGTRMSPAGLARLRAQGHLVPDALPGGFALFDVRSRDHDGAEVLHLAYSDGLSTTSLFSQPGELGSRPPDGFVPTTVAGEPVWASAGAPQRMVWAGGGRVWTLVSDAPSEAVAEAVRSLPHEALPVTGAGWGSRLARGAARLAGALNPFS
jgi:sigma-E factor negative regulatory protein RseB